MNIFEKLSNTDRDMITNYIESYAGYDGEPITMRTSLEHILRFWNANKIDLFKVFGGELILTKRVSVAKPIRMIEQEISRAVYDWGSAGKTFYTSFERWCRTQQCDYSLRSMMYLENLALNVYTGQSFTVTTPDNHKIDINSGCKISKVLGKIARAFNLEGYEDFRIAHSQCLNQKKLTGELCISIHPLDYMTMSDNNSGWSSCMSWQECGDYRQGTVEMMNSPCVVVAYLKGSDDMDIPFGNTWNNKKWRQLFIVTPCIVTGIRQYPYNNDELNGITLQWLRDLAQINAGWGPYEETAVLAKNGELFPVASLGRQIRLHFNTRFMYNDFYSEHLSYVSEIIPDVYELCFSGESECLECGEDISEDRNISTNALQCCDCDDGFYCAECGERISCSNMVTLSDGTRVCEYCYNEYWKECSMCEDMQHENCFNYVYLRVKEEMTSYYIRVCDKCMDSDKFKEKYGTYHRVPYGRWDERIVVDLECFKDIDSLDDFDVSYSDDYENYREYYKSLEAVAEDETEARADGEN